jgi:hypothetical protein
MTLEARSITRRGAVAAILALIVSGVPQIAWAAPAASGVVLHRTDDRVTLENGYTHLAFDLAAPQIDDVRADFTGRGDYGPSLTAPGSGIVLERHDVAPLNVVNEVGITDDAHRADGQITPQFSYAAELLPAANTVATPPDDGFDNVPVRMPDTSGSAPNIAVARGQTFTLDSAQPYSTLDVFGASSDGAGTGAFTLSFADGSTEQHTITLPDWGSPGTQSDALHVAFSTAYRHTPTGNDAPVPFGIYHAVVPIDSTQPLASITFPDGVPNTSTSQNPTSMNVLGVTLRQPGGGFVTPDLAAHDRPLGAGDHVSSAGAGPGLSVHVLKHTPSSVRVRIDGIVDDARDPLLTSSWTLSLARGSRGFSLSTNTTAMRSGPLAGADIAAYLAPTSVYGLFHRGVEQMMNSAQPYFASDDPVHRVYTLGGGGSVDLTNITGQRQTVLLDASSGNWRSGLQQVLTGRYPVADAWDSSGWGQSAGTTVETGEQFTTSADIAVNDFDFPVGTLAADNGLPFDDLRAIYTATYGTTVGALDSYALPGETGVTIAHPTRAYDPGHNFYDPDTWMSVSSLVYSGDPYLQNEARKLIETSGAKMLPSGQIPHHFNGSEPVYVALSGATQTGPNIFWISAALQYAKATGDMDWLRAHVPDIERALKFLTDRYNPALQLVQAPGPLWIDVFIRENYTSDTNAYLVELLRDVADAEAATGEGHLASQHRQLSQDIADGMNAHLWAGDHYITQLNPDGTTRDFVDYDANLLAVAFGVAPADRAAKILARVDSGPCTHAMPTYVSERVYGPADTYGGNTGDSNVTMERIAWADGRARAAVGDTATLNDVVVAPVRTKLLAGTWLPERYDCQGNDAHNGFYHGYPEMLAMTLRESVYGINMGLSGVDIAPNGPTAYGYHVGDVDVSYNAAEITATLPGQGNRQFTVHGLTPGAVYLVRDVKAHGGNAMRPGRVTVGADGVLRFAAPVGPALRVEACHIG